MKDLEAGSDRTPVVLAPGEGREFPMGRLSAVSIRVGDRWIDADSGAFVLVPGGTPHDFENRTDARAGMLNVSAPGDFESQMPGIADWFRDRAPEDSDC